MSGTAATEILVAASDVDVRLLECLADCRATLVRTFEEAQRALRERLFRMIVIDLNFDDVRMFDLLHHLRSLSDLRGVPVVCVQAAEAGSGLGAAFDRLVRRLGGTAFIDLRRDDEVLAIAFEHLRQIVGAERTEGAAARPGPRRLCVLIVGHDVDAAHRIGDLLEDIGHDVDYAYDGALGVDAARRLRPDAVFVAADPGLDGCQLARRLRGEPGLHGALIIALTGTVSEENLRRMREAGFDHHVVKWVDRRSLQYALDRLLAQRSP